MIRQATASASTEALPPAGTQVLDALRDLPGLVHACVLDGDRVVVETGGDGGTAALLVAWARRASAVSSARGRCLEDVIVSTASADHLARRVPGPGALWVGVRVDRAHGNLALARRRLARAVRTDTAGTAPDVVVTRGTPVIEPLPTDPPVVPDPRAAPEPRTWHRTALVEPITVPPPAAPAPAPPPHDLFTPVMPSGSLATGPGAEPPPGPLYTLARLPEPAPEGAALPQRRPGASAPPPAPPSAPPSEKPTARQGAHRERSAAAVSRWRRDEGTLRRLLVGLRRLA